jgi:hypothetical protein
VLSILQSFFPFFFTRYFCLLICGLSGIVISNSPLSNNELLTDSLNLVRLTLHTTAISSVMPDSWIHICRTIHCSSLRSSRSLKEELSPYLVPTRSFRVYLQAFSKKNRNPTRIPGSSITGSAFLTLQPQ